MSASTRKFVAENFAVLCLEHRRDMKKNEQKKDCFVFADLALRVRRANIARKVCSSSPKWAEKFAKTVHIKEWAEKFAKYFWGDDDDMGAKIPLGISQVSEARFMLDAECIAAEFEFYEQLRPDLCIKNRATVIEVGSRT